MTSNRQLTSWPGFLQALQTFFAPSQYEDPTGALFKLTQKGSVNAYLSKFEDLANRIIGLAPPFLLRYFIFGLSPEIRQEVQALKPRTLVQEPGLARLQEEKFLNTRRPFHGHLNSVSDSNFFPSAIAFPQTPSTPSLPSPLLVNPSKPIPSVSIKRLSPEELTLHHKRGLCFNFNEKYHRGHKYASKVFLLIAK